MIEIRINKYKADLGYVLAKSEWGKGYMPEAMQALTDWALVQDESYRVWAVCDVENAASARVMEKVGMQREGVLRRLQHLLGIPDHLQLKPQQTNFLADHITFTIASTQALAPCPVCHRLLVFIATMSAPWLTSLGANMS